MSSSPNNRSSDFPRLGLKGGCSWTLIVDFHGYAPYIKKEEALNQRPTPPIHDMVDSYNHSILSDYPSIYTWFPSNPLRNKGALFPTIWL